MPHCLDTSPVYPYIGRSRNSVKFLFYKTLHNEVRSIASQEAAIIIVQPENAEIGKNRRFPSEGVHAKRPVGGRGRQRRG